MKPRRRRSKEASRLDLFLSSDATTAASPAATDLRVAMSKATNKLLVDVLRRHFLFSTLHGDDLSELCTAMHRMSVSPGKHIITKGEIGEHFYIVVEGALEKLGESSNDAETILLGPGSSFGELALMHNSPREETIRAVLLTVSHNEGERGTDKAEAAVVYSLSRANFRKLVAKQQAAKAAAVASALRRVPLLEGLSERDLAALSRSVRVVDFAPGEQIIRRGDEGKEMFVVKKGSVVCHVRDNEVRANITATEATVGSREASSIDEDEDEDTAEGTLKSRPRRALSSLDTTQEVTIGPGGWFGERALLFHESRAADVFACKHGQSSSDAPPATPTRLTNHSSSSGYGADDMTTTCYTISAKTFNQLLGNRDDVIAMMNRALKLQALQALGLCDLLQTDEIGTELPSCPSSRLEVPPATPPPRLPSLTRSQKDQLLSDLVSLVKVRILARGECVVRQGEPASHFFIVKSGAIKIVTESAMKEAAGGDGTTLTESELLSKGECFGEAALLPPSSTGVGKDGLVPPTTLRYSVTAFAHHDESGDGIVAVFTLARAELISRGLVDWLLTDSQLVRILSSNVPFSSSQFSSTSEAELAAPGLPRSSAALMLSSDLAFSSVNGTGEVSQASRGAELVSSYTGKCRNRSTQMRFSVDVKDVEWEDDDDEDDGKTDELRSVRGEDEGSVLGAAAAAMSFYVRPKEAAVGSAAFSQNSRESDVVPAERVAPPGAEMESASALVGKANTEVIGTTVKAAKTSLQCSNGLHDLAVSRTLGCGSFGRVKVATHNESGTILALKILQKDTVVEMRQVKNIARERNIIAALAGHPNILQLYGTFQDADCLYMMLELVPGGELYRLMHGDGTEENRLSFSAARFYAAQVLTVYEHIHNRDIIYRDLKPENLLVTAEGYLKVIDWGFAKDLSGSSDNNTTFTLCGTPEYLAPEVLNGLGHGRAADLWSLGVVLFEMLVGYTPFVGDDINDKMAITRRILGGELEWPKDMMGSYGSEGNSTQAALREEATDGGLCAVASDKENIVVHNSKIDQRMIDLVTRLLALDPLQRLGCTVPPSTTYVHVKQASKGEASYEERYYLHDIMQHPVYTGEGREGEGYLGNKNNSSSSEMSRSCHNHTFDWGAMRSFAMPAPWVPKLPDGAFDVSNFDDIYDDDEEEIVPFDGLESFDDF